ncbi:MAG TPA: response regulator transcription factor [Burkholderiales bacterium]|nr:response regulator transcription factor [Burkholderiales bacterium]
MQPSIRILIADDHEIVRAGFAQFIADQGDMKVTGEASTGDEVIALIRREQFDVVLLDISMPHKNGIDCLRVIRQINPTLPVLMLSGYPEEHYAVNLLRSGASGYISKTAPPEELMRAIRVVARGKRYLSETAADLVSAELAHPTDKKLHETLSEREFQIFRKLAAGQSPTEIAEELHLSVKTVSTYRARVLEKMNLKTNADLTYYAIKNSLLD